MGRNRSSDVAPTAESDGRFGDALDPRRITGLSCLLLGASQLPLAFILAERTTSAALFPVGGAGWFLIGIGMSLLGGMEPFAVDWTDDARVEWAIVSLTFALAVAAVVAAGIVVSAV